jgi:hypothetical protein
MAAWGKHQPDRPDIFINTDWGIPKESLSADEAAQSNLILFKDRWVTKAERGLLRRQRLAYLAIRALSGLLIVVSAFLVLLACINTFATNPSFVAVIFLIAAVVTALCVAGLWRFDRWAWRLAKVVRISAGRRRDRISLFNVYQPVARHRFDLVRIRVYRLPSVGDHSCSYSAEHNCEKHFRSGS